MSSRKVRSLIVSKLWSVDWVELSCLSIQSFFQHTPRNTSNLDELQVTLVSPVRVSSSILVDRTDLFLYLDSFAVTIIRFVLCGRCLFLFSMSCLSTAVVCIYARWTLLYHSSSRNCDCIFSRSWCVDVDTVTDSTSFLPLHELWMFFRGNVVTSVFAFQSYLGLTTGSFPITSGTILEEPLYLEKGHFATLLASPFVAVPLWIFHGIVEGT